MSNAAQLAVDAISYQDLYARWEQGNWKAMEIDFTKDRAGWEALTDMQRRSALWVYSMFFVGEDEVTDNLSPYIDAAPTEEQKYFLATQQVDEARHAVFFARFFHEVVGASGDSIGDWLNYAEPQLSWGFRKVFDKLNRLTEELRRDHSLPKFAQAIAMYHLVVEATLAQPGQHYIEDYFTKSGEMPGFSAGIANVARDEQRHIGFGVKALADCFRASSECKAAVAELFREVMPYSLGVFYPPNMDREYTRCWGFEMEDIFEFGVQSLESKMKAAGYPLDEMPPGVFPLDLTISPRERAERMVRMMELGLIGDPEAEPDRSPEAQRLLFELLTRSVDHDAVNGSPLTIQWRFSDAAPWYIRIDNGATSTAQGEAPAPDLSFESSWRTWVESTVRQKDPRQMILRRKLRPHGSVRQLWRMKKIFPARG